MKFSGKNTTRLLCLFLILSLLFFICTLRELRERAVLSVVRSACAEFDVPLPLVLAVIRTESGFRRNATSSAGARGYMQLMPETFHDLISAHESLAYTDEQITDTVANIRCGTYYLPIFSPLFRIFAQRLPPTTRGKAMSENGLKTKRFPQTVSFTRSPSRKREPT